MIELLKQDNFFSGIIYGLLCILISYFLMLGISKLYFNHYQNDLLQPPKLQMIVLAINIIIFRFVMVRKIETGKGMLLAIFLTTIIYIINNRSII